MGIVVSTIVCIGLLILFNFCGKKGGRLPAKPIIHLFLLGLAAAAVITIATIITGGGDAGLFGLSSSNIFFILIDNFILTALVEEGLKYLAIRLYMRKKDYIKSTYQGLVAVSAVAAGFVAAENVLYLINESGLILRLTFGIFGHFIYAVFMGTDIAKAIRTDDLKKRKKLYFRALLIPVLMHGVYDSILEILQLDFDELLWIFVLLNAIALFVVFYVIAAIKKIIAAVRELKAEAGQTEAIQAEAEKVEAETVETEQSKAENVMAVQTEAEMAEAEQTVVEITEPEPTENVQTEAGNAEAEQTE